MPRVSIVMPVYNGEEYLNEAIDSIIGQSFQDWEFIIINEYGSNPKATEILNEYTTQDKRIKIIQNSTKLGISASLNLGLQNANGEYIARMDADDISLPTRIEKQVAYMDMHPEISICGTKVEVFGDCHMDWSIETNPDQITTDILFFSPCIHPTIMLRASSLRENDFRYNENYRATEDYDLFSRVVVCGKIANIDEVLFRYRLMKGNTTFRNNEIGIQIYSEVMMRQFKSIGLDFKQEEIELLSPHISLKNLSGKDVFIKLQNLDLLLKKIYLCNSKAKKYDTIFLSRTLHKRFVEAYQSIQWCCKNFEQDKIDEIYHHSIFRNADFGGNYIKTNAKILPTVTVLMPTYNSEKYVIDTMDSVLRQSFFDFEFLIVNEFGSSDRTVEFIQSFPDPRIRILQNESKLGLAESLNRGIQAARGKYIARIDADDLCHPDRLKKQVEYMENHPECGVCGSWQHHWGIDTEWIHRAPEDHEQVKASLIYRCELCHSTLLLRKSFFIENNLFYDSRYAAEDYELWTRAVFLMGFHNIPEVLGEYRVGEENITSKKLQMLSSESGELATRTLKEYLNIYVPTKHIKYLSNWINEFNHTIDPIDKRKHLKIERHILKEMWNQNKRLHVYDEDCLLSVINQRWKWVTNDWVFGTEQGEIQSIEKLFDNKYSLMKRVRNKIKKYDLKKPIKKMLMPFYRPFKHRVCDRFDQLRQQLWDIDGHLKDHRYAIEKRIDFLEEMIILQNKKFENIVAVLEHNNSLIQEQKGELRETENSIHMKMGEYAAALERYIYHTINDNIRQLEQSMNRGIDTRIWEAEQNINQATDARIWKAEENINQITDERIWKAEQNINQVTDTRVWKAEENINRITDARIWKAEQNINQVTDARIWKMEESIGNGIEKTREEFHRHIDFTYRDIMIALEKQKSYLPPNNIRLITRHPVAYESLDHLHPHGTIRDNTRHPRFVRKCEELLKDKDQISFLDLGCSGGGMVLEAALRGHVAMGLEGSDASQNEQRAEWRLLGDRLQTCDITKPFELIQKDGTIHHFDIISAWEVLEHIAENDIPQLLNNISKHLSEDGYFIASISNWDDIDPVSGVNWHVTCHQYEWWKTLFENSGFLVCSQVFQPIDLARGGYNQPHCYEMPCPNNENTFHIVAQKRSKS